MFMPESQKQSLPKKKVMVKTEMGATVAPAKAKKDKESFEVSMQEQFKSRPEVKDSGKRQHSLIKILKKYKK